MMQIIITEADIDPSLSIAQNIVRIALEKFGSAKQVARFLSRKDNTIYRMSLRIRSVSASNRKIEGRAKSPRSLVRTTGRFSDQ